MSKTMFLLGGLSLMLCGCLPVASLHPYYTEETVVQEPNLVGIWTAEDMTWEFQQQDSGAYGLTIAEGEKMGQFKVHVFQLEDQLLMDLYPEELPEDLPLADFYRVHLFPVHHVMRLAIVDSELHLWYLELDKMTKILEAYPHLLRHEGVAETDMIVLTDSSQAIQTFFSTFMDYKALWSDEIAEFKRKLPEESPD
jgi:hypothetical protein